MTGRKISAGRTGGLIPARFAGPDDRQRGGDAYRLHAADYPVHHEKLWDEHNGSINIVYRSFAALRMTAKQIHVIPSGAKDLQTAHPVNIWMIPRHSVKNPIKFSPGLG